MSNSILKSNLFRKGEKVFQPSGQLVNKEFLSLLLNEQSVEMKSWFSHDHHRLRDTDRWHRLCHLQHTSLIFSHEGRKLSCQTVRKMGEKEKDMTWKNDGITHKTFHLNGRERELKWNVRSPFSFYSRESSSPSCLSNDWKCQITSAR